MSRGAIDVTKDRVCCSDRHPQIRPTCWYVQKAHLEKHKRKTHAMCTTKKALYETLWAALLFL